MEDRDDDLAEANLDWAGGGPGGALDAPPVLEEVLPGRREDEERQDPEAAYEKERLVRLHGRQCTGQSLGDQ